MIKKLYPLLTLIGLGGSASSCFKSAVAKRLKQLNWNLHTFYICYLCVIWDNFQIHVSTDVAMETVQSEGEWGRG